MRCMRWVNYPSALFFTEIPLDRFTMHLLKSFFQFGLFFLLVRRSHLTTATGPQMARNLLSPQIKELASIPTSTICMALELRQVNIRAQHFAFAIPPLSLRVYIDQGLKTSNSTCVKGGGVSR